MKKSQIGIILLIIALGAAFIASIFYFSGDKILRPMKLDKVRVQLKWLHQSQFAGFYAADQLGYYAAQGIEVELLPGGPTVDVNSFDSLADGSVDFSVVGGFDLLLGAAAGYDAVALMSIYQSTPTVFMSPSERGINKIEGFVGEKIGIQQPEQRAIYRSMMKNKGLDFSGVREYAAAYDLQEQLKLEYNIMPGYIINEYLSALENGIEMNVFKPSDYGVDVYGDVLVASKEWLNANQDLVQRFVRATENGWGYTIVHPDLVPEIVSHYNPQADHNHELLMMTESLSLLLPPGSHFGHMDDTTWKAMSDMLFDNGLIDEPAKINDIYDTSFMSINRHTLKN
ncbi:MAG: ABC transporter substrate-binding protein [Patescibacteria group bacterium]